MATHTVDQKTIDMLKGCLDKVDKVEEEYDTKEAQACKGKEQEVEALYKKRQPLLDSINGFWGSVLNHENSPVKQYFNATCDPKIVRAITSLNVEKNVAEDGAVSRKVIMKLGVNPYIESTELSREIDHQTKTTHLSGVNWKSGTDHARKDSFFFMFFDKLAFPGEEQPVNWLEDLAFVFSDPEAALNGDDDDGDDEEGAEK